MFFENEDSLKNFVARINYEKRIYGEDWGFFITNSDSINIQTVEMLSSGGIPAEVGVLEYQGTILSDTVFFINVITIPKWDKFYNQRILYSFKEFSMKPDSINWVEKEMRHH